MEPLSLFSVTVASILMSFSGNSAPTEESVVKTHTYPEIAGLWDLELDMNTGAPKREENYKDTITKLLERQKLSGSLINSSEVFDDLDNKLDVNQLGSINKTVKTLNSHVTQTKSSSTAICHERYNFAADHELLTTSGEEWTYRQYLYQHQENGLPILAIATIYDNNRKDCAGRQVDQAGESMIVFVDYKADDNKMRWCIDDKGLNCIMSFRRLLP